MIKMCSKCYLKENVMVFFNFFFFFKQKTAYEIMPSLVGSEMCIGDQQTAGHPKVHSGYLPSRQSPLCRPHPTGPSIRWLNRAFPSVGLVATLCRIPGGEV